MEKLEKLQETIDAAYEALFQDKLDEARRLLDAARRVDPDAADTRLLEIDLYDAEGQAEEAVSAAEEALTDNKRSMLLKLKLATLLLDVYDDTQGARPLLEDLVARIDKKERPDVGGGEEAELDFKLELYLTLADCRGADHDPKGALQLAERAVEEAPEDPMARVAAGAARFDLCELDEAERAVALALDIEPRCADAFWLRGRILTARGDHDAADKAFARAVSIDPERFQKPYRVTEDRFAALMEESLEELPPPVKKYLKNVALTVVDIPDAGQLKQNDPPLSPGSLGLYEGTPPSLASGDDPWSHFPKHITLFRKNIEISAANEDDLRDLVSTTLLHEVGHYLGLDEDDLDERGLS